MGSGTDRRSRMRILITCLAVAGLAAVLAAVLRPGPRRLWPADIDMARENERFSRLCQDFLRHRVSAEDFCAQARPPWLTEAMSQPGGKVPARLPLAGTVTLKGQTDHSGTEVAVIMAYDHRRLDFVILSPFSVRTGKDGRFDFSTLELEAWQAAAKPTSLGLPLFAPCYATPPLSPPTAMLYIRHKGFDSRLVRAQQWDMRLPPYGQGAATVDLGGLKLLPEGIASKCYDFFGTRERRSPDSFGLLFRNHCHLVRVREHLQVHPDCPVADDALYWFLLDGYFKFYRPGSAEGREMADGFALFRERFLGGRDNTGILMGSQPGVSPDGSWGAGFEKLAAEFRKHNP